MSEGWPRNLAKLRVVSNACLALGGMLLVTLRK